MQHVTACIYLDIVFSSSVILQKYERIYDVSSCEAHHIKIYIS